jgi:long-chain acyl-CoA synthetase
MSEAALPPGWPAMSIEQAHALLTAPGSPMETAEVVIRGIRTKVWKHLPASLRDVVAAGRPVVPDV